MDPLSCGRGVVTLRRLDDLKARGLLPSLDEALRDVADRYAIAVSDPLAALIDPSDVKDPIAAQFIPSKDELRILPQELVDPIGDKAHTPVPGIVHRYPDRVLLKAVAVCPVYCRFCFRREMVGPGKEKNLPPDALDTALGYIRQHPEIREVILTGGDPFMLSAEKARALTNAIGNIDHIRIIRWHTRMPVADPSRIDNTYIEALNSSSKTVYVAIHINHPKELTPSALKACAALADKGIALLSQTVLLKGVNDNIDTLRELMYSLVDARIRPYNLNQLDYAPGTSHFRVPLAEAQTLVQQLRDTSSGLCQPHFVIDIPGGVSKANAALSDVRLDHSQVRGRDGVWRKYTD